MFYPSDVPGELDHGIITARARRYDAMAKGLVYESSKAMGEELGLRALASRLGLEVVDDLKTTISADATLLNWYVENEEQLPQSLMDLIASERRRFDSIYHTAAICTPNEED